MGFGNWPVDDEDNDDDEWLPLYQPGGSSLRLITSSFLWGTGLPSAPCSSSILLFGLF